MTLDQRASRRPVRRQGTAHLSCRDTCGAAAQQPSGVSHPSAASTHRAARSSRDPVVRDARPPAASTRLLRRIGCRRVQRHVSGLCSPARAWLRTRGQQARLDACRAGLRSVDSYSATRAPSAGQGGPSRSTVRMSRPCWCPCGNSSRTSHRQAATMARTSRRHSSSRT
jgi:hypothetical protein